MKHSAKFSSVSSRYSFIQGCSVILLAVILLSPPLSSAQRQKNSISFRERTMNAAQQLREYRQQLRLTKENARSTSALHSEVAIRINRTAKTSSTIYYYDDIESGANGWTSAAYTGSDLWHQSILNASSATHSWWPGIELQSNYDNGARIDNALISPALDLSSAIAPVELLFTENYVTERGWDYCMVDVSTDGGTNWTHLRGGYGAAPAGGSDGWIITTLDLSAYAGQNINLRFYFDT
ncbi:MAG TPA: hypothetical protein VGR15_08925, partial [Bacteroidota bacterium]|nr:hypothetical protein [Bacteroidota bacterium]